MSTEGNPTCFFGVQDNHFHAFSRNTHVPDLILPQNDPQVEALLKESEVVRSNFRKLQDDFNEINELLNCCKRLLHLPCGEDVPEVRVKVRPIEG